MCTIPKITLEINHTQITNTKDVKFLGMWINEYLNWQSHIAKLTLKLTRNLNLLKYSQNLMPTNTKKLIYHAHIGSHLQYGILLWGNGATNEQLNKLQKIQNKCLEGLKCGGVCIFYCNCRVDCYGKLFSLNNNERRYEYKRMKSNSTVRSGNFITTKQHVDNVNGMNE